ncbi:MAG: SDR family NAD(P)-dependent oxidoreductase [bacterium]|nr:SDR family NAD(P)-dependent oxidoreductase [bacterium]
MSMNRYQPREDWTGLEIAVIGLNCRFPGADGPDRFWENLKNGVESITFFSEEELKATGGGEDLLSNPSYVPARGVIEDAEYFDSFFFGYKPYEAEVMDPQIRLFYECCWTALEISGYSPDTYDGLVGLFAGASNNRSWEIRALMSPRAQSMGAFTMDHYIDRDFLSTRIAYRLNLRGPAVTVKTACSTALVAVDMASRSLLTGQCEIALAGGVTVISSDAPGYTYREGMVMSPDGHCRAFDAGSQGVIFSEGAGVVVLKSLNDAIEDNDTIHAIIRGSAVNNDGNRKGTYEAPCIDGQAEVIEAALHMAEIEPETITYVEAFGTGTEIGDPIEIEGLKRAFKTEKKQFCAIGSVKTNFGHLDTAAGAAGLIKTILAMKHRLIPPSLHYKNPNPKIDFANSPFYVNTGLSEWKPNGTPLRAGVSSFGVGGTNAHVILEEPPEVEAVEDASGTSKDEKPRLITLSARDESALDQASGNLVNYFNENPGQSLADAAYTLQVGRKHFKHRKVWVVNPGSPDFTLHHTAKARDKVRPVFMFPGQGAQYVNMGLDIYRTEPVFREQLDRCFAILKPLMANDLKAILYPVDSPDTPDINRPGAAQPLLFVFEYALAKLLQSWGIEPYAMIGHGIGEYVAACLSGVFTLEDALKIVSIRGKLLGEMPPGAMPGASLPEPDPLLTAFEEAFKDIRLNKPERPYISNVTGDWISVEEAMSPQYWVNHLRSIVRFNDGLSPLFDKEGVLFMELGPGRELITLAEKHTARKPGHILIDLVRPANEESPDDDHYLLSKIGQLWIYGVTVDWAGFYPDEQPHRVPLPTYPFQRRHYRVEGRAGDVTGAVMSGISSPTGKNPDISKWFYIPSWKRSLPEQPDIKPGETPAPLNWLVFMDEIDIGSQLVERLERHLEDSGGEGSVIRVLVGEGFGNVGNVLFTLNPRQSGDYDELLKTLKGQGKIPNRIVHMWSITGGESGLHGLPWHEKWNERGFYSLLYLAQSMGNEGIGEEIILNVITNQVQDVTGDEVLCPQKSTILGPAGVIPVEYTNITSRCIDVQVPGSGGHKEKMLLRQLTEELMANPTDKVVAYRNHHRLVQTYEQVPVKASPNQTRPSRLKDGGVYLVTGGTGGIGLEIAGHLARTVSAKLILTGRSEPVGLKKEKIRALEEAGSEVMVFAADVTDQGSMETVIREAEERLGPIDGVLHAAGVPGGGMIQFKTPKQAGDVMAPKVKGTLVLDKVLGDRPLDFFILCSSFNSVFPVLGQVDYYAANAFLDTFAYYRTSRGGTFTVSINWDTWQEVGMAVETAKQFGGGMESDHPLFDRRLGKRREEEVYETRFILDKQWVLNEQKVIETGKGLVPGVTYLEMAHKAFMDHLGDETGETAILIGDVYFLNPLMVGEGEEREARLSLKPVGSEEGRREFNYEFQVQSRAAGRNPGTGDAWERHAVGKIRQADISPDRRRVQHNLEEIAARCAEQDIIVSKKDTVSHDGLLDFGPRWKNIRRVRVGEGEALATLELDEQFMGEPEHYYLHPALMDSAVGFYYPRMGSRGGYIPFSYKQLIIKGPLPGKLFSHCRLLEEPGGGSSNGSVKFDIVIMDEEGIERVNIKEFTMLEVSESVKGRMREKEKTGDLQAPVTITPEPTGNKLLESGILPVEGIEVFNRVLTAPFSQVVVSTTDLHSRFLSSTLPPALEESGERDTAKSPGARLPRPDISTVYVSPKTETEQKVAHLWQELLGIEQVGINDDFFQLGGDSVNILQLNNDLKKVFNRDIPVAIMFRFQTIHAFTQYLKLEEVGQTPAASDEDEDRSEAIEKSKNRLKARMRKR